MWPDFQKWHRQADEEAQHQSILLLAMKRGHLGRVTSAVHRYLITGNRPKPNVRPQYLKDLRERWLSYPDPKERNKKFRIFFGRLAELQFAEWLELEGWRVCELEALRKEQENGPDIEAWAARGGHAAFEVKFIGVEDDDFTSVLKSLADQPAAGPVSPYAAANYILFRAYEAARQLHGMSCDRIAVVVVDDPTWHRFNLQLGNGWIDWTKPSFFPADEVWERFLECQQNRYPDLAADLQPTLASLKAVWILRMSHGYQYNLEVEVPFRAPSAREITD